MHPLHGRRVHPTSRGACAAAGALIELLAAGCGGSSADAAPASPPASAPCPAAMSLGYRVAQLAGRKAAIWYPSSDVEQPHAYSSDTSSTLAANGAPAGCTRFPLVVFSHGYGRCGTHFEWTNLVCAGIPTVAGCVQARPNAALVDGYAFAFLDAFLKAAPEALDALSGDGLAAWQAQPR